MKFNRIIYSITAFLIPLLLVCAGVCAVYSLYQGVGLDIKVQQRIPGQDNKPKSETADTAADITGSLEVFDEDASDLPGAWPGFRGPDLDNISKESVKLSSKWPDNGPKIIWSCAVGEGFAGASVLHGRVYVMDYDREKQADVLRCMSLDNGHDIWRYSYPVKIKRWHGMSRTVPAVTDKYVVGIGPKCHVTCLDSVTGRFLWNIDLVHKYQTKIPQWYTSQCPLIDKDRVIIAPAGKSCLMMAVNCADGKVIWQTPNPDNWVMTHSSIVPVDFKGRRFYVYCGGSTSSGGVVGVSADTGKIAWYTDKWKVRTNVPVPVRIGEDRMFVSAGYAQRKYGCAMLRLTETNSSINIEPDFIYSSSVFGTMQQSPIFYKGYIYGVNMDKQLVCLDLQGKVVWNSTSVHKFGFGPFLIADDKLYILDDNGLLSMLDISADGFKILSQFEVFKDGVDCWGPMAIVSGRLILRDLTRMVCLDLK